MTQIFFIGWHGIYSEISCGGDYSRNFAEATCSVVTDTPWDRKKSHRFHRSTQIFLGTFFKSRRFRRWRRFFHHRMTRNLFGDFLLRRLLTEFRGGDLFGRCRYPLRSDKAIHLRFKKICVYLWNLWDKNNHTKKNLRHLRNLRDQKQSSTYRAPAIGQRPNICENPWVIR